MVALRLRISSHITADPLDILTHYALGDMPSFIEKEPSPVAWVREAHRGVHLLQSVVIPKSQRRYVFSPAFEFRFDSAFEEVIRACAQRASGHTWILPELIEGYQRLFEMGFAHSYEAWHDGQLAGGCFGVHLGGYASVESTFYRVSNAAKIAYGRTLLHLQARGFLLVDSNPVADPALNYGEEWIPRWKFEGLLRHAIEQPVSLFEGRPFPALPRSVRRAMRMTRLIRRLAHGYGAVADEQT
jgi:leucyl/phenylalanyl-tRNA--protein transferase